MARCHRHIICSLLFLLLSALSVSAQIPIRVSAVHQSPPDSVDVARGEKRHFWRAAGEVFGFNIGLWAFDRYVQKGDFAYISFNSIKENFKHGYHWDNDNMGTNTFLHPYSGSLYYNAARANGFNYWQSSLFSIAGSTMWEWFMENEYPSTNDNIATPIGGAAMGEVLFRASDALIDDRTSGAERFGREAAVFVISPLRGFTRIITGDAWRRRPTRGRLFGTPSFAVRLSLGVRMLQRLDHLNRMRVGGVMEIDVEYGDRYEIKSTKPYDYFTMRAQLQAMSTQPMLTQFQLKGRLLAREFLEEKSTHLSVGLFQHFDYYDSNSLNGSERVPFKLGIPASLGGGVLFRESAGQHWTFDAYAHVNGVILGSILSDHYSSDQRNYNWASGFSMKGGLNIVLDRRRFSFAVTHEFYRMFTWQGYRYGTDLAETTYRTLNTQGDKSVASFHITEVRADLHLYRHLYGSVAFTKYIRSTHYRDYPYVHSSSQTLSLMLSYKF